MKTVPRGTSRSLWRDVLFTNVLLLTLAIMHPPPTCARAQSQRAQAGLQAFEVASVRPSAPNQTEMNGLYTYPGGRLVGRGCRLKFLIMVAYNVQPFQISGGPGWTDFVSGEAFDIQATPPESSLSARGQTSSPKIYPGEEGRQMLQSMLADRFQLQIHHKVEEGPVFVLTRGRGDSKLIPSKDKSEFPWAGGIGGGAPGSDGIRGMNISMPELAARLSGWLGRPVSDQTRIQGSFDFEFHSGEGAPDSSTEIATPILTSIKGIGLSLNPSKGPVETIVIDHVERPSPN